MIVVGNKRTYCFDGIHIPRIYINDIRQVKLALNILHKNGSLTNKEMTEETERVRSEDIREIFYLLWKLGFGIDVTKKGREIAFVANDKLEGLLELEDKDLKKFVLERLKLYNPFVAILDKLIEYKDKSFTEKDITKDFHKGRYDGGRIDNTHPLLRWSKDEDWKLVKDKTISEHGIKFVNESKKLKICYIHHTVDLKASKELNIVAHIISDASFEENKKRLSFDDILGLISDNEILKMDEGELKSVLKNLLEIGLPITLDRDWIEINSKIYHDITPQLYVKFGLHTADGIDELDIVNEIESKKIDEKKLLNDFKNVKTLIIDDESVKLKNYPTDSRIVNYKNFLEIQELLPYLDVRTIILSPGWKPLKVSKINGILLSFVKFGGNLIIFYAPMGRIGSNRNLFNWLPYDLARISFVHSSEENIKGYFTFPFGEEFSFTSKDGFEEIERGSKRYSILITNYYLGRIIFSGFKESKEIFTKIKDLEKEVKIDVNSRQWTYRFVPSLNRIKGVNTEFDLYPLLKDILKKNFDIECDPEIKGKPGQTDLLIIKPFFCCCEVTPPNSNATGFSKVSEVKGHRDTIVFKDRKSGKKKFGDNEVGACVFGPSFTIEAGEDKAGAVDMANAMGISLISYRDLFELICLNDKVKLNKDDIIRVFFNESEKAEAAIRIYELIKEKLIR